MSYIALVSGSFPNRGAHQIFGGGEATIGGIAGSEPGAGEFTAGRLVVPVSLLLKNAVLKLSVAPGAGKTIAYRFKDNNNTSLSTELDIADAATFIASDIEASVPALTPSTNLTIQATMNYINTWIPTANTPATSRGIFATEYQYLSDTSVSFYCAGSDLLSCSFNASNSFGTFNFINITAGTVEDVVQSPFPFTGTLRRIALAWSGLSAGTSALFVLRKNGVDTAFSFTLTATAPTSNWQAVVDTVINVPVTAGDLLSWRIIRTAGAGGGVNILVGLGCS